MPAAAVVEWHLETLTVASLTAWHKNPRQLTQAQYEQLRTSLDKFGLIEKPVVNADSENTVIGGHQRLRILHDQGVDAVECWVPERELSVREIEECNIRLNRNLGSWDFDVLANVFEVKDLLDWGFTEIELQLDSLANDVADSQNGDAASSDNGHYDLIVECDSESARTGLLTRLSEEGYVCRAIETAGSSSSTGLDVVEVQWL